MNAPLLRLAPILALLACSSGGDTGPVDSGPQVDPFALSVTSAGPFNVGHRVYELSYTPPDGSGARTIPVDLWYPTWDEDGRETDYDDLIEDELAFRDASLAPPVYADGYPVHVYSHGNQGFGGTSAFLSRALAKHGWVVIAPGHVGNRLQDYIDPKPTSIYIHRATDVSAALDALATELPEANTERVVLSGHSFGNYTCWSAGGATLDVAGIEALCESGGTNSGTCTEGELQAFREGLEDPRVVATVHMAGTIDRRWFGDSGHEGMNGPILFMSGTADPVGQQAQWDEMSGVDYTWLELSGACHQSFALGTCSSLEPERAFPIVEAYTLAFSRFHLLGDSNEEINRVLDGTTSIDSAVTFRRQTP